VAKDAKDAASTGLGEEVSIVKTERPSGARPERIAIDDFARIDLRVAEVVAAEAMPRSKKLLRLTISLGEETRTVLAGIAEHYAPADLVGRKVVVVANLQPAKLMGVESNGMVRRAGAWPARLDGDLRRRPGK
jgi:methionyl-tRNA synthetase